MARVFLVVMDSVGIGGAPDADKYFNGDVSDFGSNTVLHIAEHMQKKGCPLSLPQLKILFSEDELLVVKKGNRLSIIPVQNQVAKRILKIL